MADAPLDPRWPKLMSLSVHEFRTPMTVVAGYIRMLLKDRGGPLNDQQRRLLEEAEKSCGRLSALLAEMSDLAHLEDGSLTYDRQPLDLRAVLHESVDRLTALPDRDVHVHLTTDDGPATIDGNADRLRTALSSLIAAMRRELVSSGDLFVIERAARAEGRRGFEILIGDRETIDAIGQTSEAALPPFDEWRGGCGLSLPIARRVLNAHGGRLWGAPGNGKAGARLFLTARA